MKNLQAYIDQKNTWGKFFNSTPITFPLTQAEVNSLASGLDSELSPENLHCDGEISQAEAMRKLRKLNKVCAELIKLDPSVRNQLSEYYP